MSASSPHRLAVLIDAENLSPTYAENVIAQAALLGRPTVCRAYGDWTGSTLGGWKKKLAPLRLMPHQASRHLRGKNTADFAIVMDAMELIHERCVDGICLVSNDSDYMELVLRIRAAGLYAYGFGHRHQAVRAIVDACDAFVFLDECDPTVTA